MANQIHDPNDHHERYSDSHPPQGDLINYFKTHSRETIAYILLVVGILLLFSEPVYGGLIVGIVAGIYFGNEIIDYLKTWKTSINSRNNYPEVARHLILGGLVIAFFISAPAIFLGCAISIGIKEMFVGQENLRK